MTLCCNNKVERSEKENMRSAEGEKRTASIILRRRRRFLAKFSAYDAYCVHALSLSHSEQSFQINNINRSPRLNKNEVAPPLCAKSWRLRCQRKRKLSVCKFILQLSAGKISVCSTRRNCNDHWLPHKVTKEAVIKNKSLH